MKGWVGQRAEGHDHSEEGRAVVSWVYLSSRVPPGPNLVTSMAPAAQGAGRFPQGSVDTPALPT